LLKKNSVNENNMGEVFRPPKPLTIDENLDRNWNKFCQSFDLFEEASERSKSDEAVKAAMFLNFRG
jgi:hypothetical protein